MTKEKFAVVSKYFSVYQAFKKEAEKLGVVYNNSFNAFEEFKMRVCNCIFIASSWSGLPPDTIGISFSNHTGNFFDLDTNFEGAIEELKIYIKQNEVKKMTLQEIEEALGHKVIIINS